MLSKERFIKPKIDKYIQLYSKNARLEEVNSSGVLTDIILTEKGYWYLFPPTISFTGGGGGGGATAEAITDNEYNLDLTSINLINEGANYTAQPVVSITPQPAYDGISAIPILTGGVYTEIPNVFISGTGGAVVTAVLTKTSVVSVNVSFGGSGYLSVPLVYFAPPSAGGIQAAGTAFVTGGQVTHIIMTNFGSNYLTPPSASFYNATFSVNAICDPVVMGGPVTSLTISNPGSKYITKPTVSLVRASNEKQGFGLGIYAGTLGAITLTRYIYDIFITKGGTGYVNGSAVNFSGGSPTTAAAATAIVSNGVVVGVNITNIGAGYTSAPTISFTGGTSVAEGTALIDYGIYATARAKMAKSGCRVYKYAWDLDETIEIDENAILSVCDRQFTIQKRDMGDTDVYVEKPIVIRIHEIGSKSIINAKNSSTNFYTGKIIDIATKDRFLPNDIKLEINSQTINRIVLSLDYDITRRTGFIKDDEFVIILKISEKEPSLLEYGSLNNINTNQSY